MRGLPPAPQMPQSLSNSGNDCAIIELILDLRGPWVSQPFPELAFSKPPLSSDLEGGDFFALRPETNGSRRDTEPLGDSGCCQKRFTIG